MLADVLKIGSRNELLAIMADYHHRHCQEVLTYIPEIEWPADNWAKWAEENRSQLSALAVQYQTFSKEVRTRQEVFPLKGDKTPLECLKKAFNQALTHHTLNEGMRQRLSVVGSQIGSTIYMGPDIIEQLQAFTRKCLRSISEDLNDLEGISDNPTPLMSDLVNKAKIVKEKISQKGGTLKAVEEVFNIHPDEKMSARYCKKLREEGLERVENCLRTGSIWTFPKRVINAYFICGEPGTGKTYLATEFQREMRQLYSVVQYNVPSVDISDIQLVKASGGEITSMPTSKTNDVMFHPSIVILDEINRAAVDGTSRSSFFLDMANTGAAMPGDTSLTIHPLSFLYATGNRKQDEKSGVIKPLTSAELDRFALIERSDADSTLDMISYFKSQKSHENPMVVNTLLDWLATPSRSMQFICDERSKKIKENEPIITLRALDSAVRKVASRDNPTIEQVQSDMGIVLPPHALEDFRQFYIIKEQTLSAKELLEKMGKVNPLQVLGALEDKKDLKVALYEGALSLDSGKRLHSLASLAELKNDPISELVGKENVKDKAKRTDAFIKEAKEISDRMYGEIPEDVLYIQGQRLVEAFKASMRYGKNTDPATFIALAAFLPSGYARDGALSGILNELDDPIHEGKYNQGLGKKGIVKTLQESESTMYYGFFSTTLQKLCGVQQSMDYTHACGEIQM